MSSNGFEAFMNTRRFLEHRWWFGRNRPGGFAGRGTRPAERPNPRAEWNGGLHHRAKAKRVLQLFMNGVSQVDTFDFKPELNKRHGQQIDFGIRRRHKQPAR